MKKIYTLIAGLLLIGGALNAQVIKDGGFQGTYASGAQVGVTTTNNYGGTTLDLATLDWQGIMKQETTAPITGTKSALIESIDDVEAATLIGSSEPKTSGFAQQRYKGAALAGKTPADFDFTFKYTFAPTGVDTAFAIVTVADSTVTGAAGILYQGIMIIPAAVTTATTGTITTWLNGPSPTGLTANRVTIIFGSSLSNWYDDAPAQVGSKFIVDDVALTFNSNSVDEASIATSKVYPNPVSSVLNVEILNAEATSIAIYSLDGSLVKSEKLNGVSGTVNVEDLKSGIYLYTISTKEGSVIQSRFLKN